MRANKFHLVRRNLLRWYDRNKRDLPWRRSREPYPIWIAETMLQQTQVKTVLPFYRRFLSAFPTIKALDRASRERVLALWSGFGYYRRAENLKKAARRIVRDHNGKVPQDFAKLVELPGIGPYTAGALMSIAFDRPYPALDGNARRVIARVFHAKSENELQRIGQQLVSFRRPGDFNQALMELGATICLARNPNCTKCPLAHVCKASRSGRFASQLLSSANNRTEKVEWPLVLIRSSNKILLRRRPPNGILAGLWEIPGGERRKSESMNSTLKRHLDGLAGQVNSLSFVGEIRHSITHRRIRATIFVTTCPDTRKLRLSHPHWRWFSLSSLHRYPLSSLCLKAIKRAMRR
jgi:A/G-specific adenine glycosylase